jgi:hypothetical protein
MISLAVGRGHPQTMECEVSSPRNGKQKLLAGATDDLRENVLKFVDMSPRPSEARRLPLKASAGVKGNRP